MNVRPPRATRSDTLFPSTSLVRSPGSRRIHSRYLRRLTDLPIAGHPVRLLVKARRFYCDAVLCGRHIFTERFESGLLAHWARRTARLDHIVHHLSRSEEHTSELQSLMRISYAVFCLKKKKNK